MGCVFIALILFSFINFINVTPSDFDNERLIPRYFPSQFRVVLSKDRAQIRNVVGLHHEHSRRLMEILIRTKAFPC